MIFSTQVNKSETCFIRFFNGAADADSAEIFVNDELLVENLGHGKFSPFHRAVPGAYKIEVRITPQESVSELMSFMEDVSYTIALTGNAEHMSFAVIPLDLRKDIKLPNIRFANVIPFDTVVDIDINGRSAAEGLMYKEVSEDVNIEPGNHSVAVYDSYNEKIIEDGLTIAAGKNYLGMISGVIEDPQNLPGLYVAEDMPLS